MGWLERLQTLLLWLRVPVRWEGLVPTKGILLEVVLGCQVEPEGSSLLLGQALFLLLLQTKAEKYAR